MIVLAWISTGEILILLAVGLLLFGGRLPEVAKDFGRVFLKLRRSLEDIRRDSGIDETLRDLDRESRAIGSSAKLPPFPPLAGTPEPRSKEPDLSTAPAIAENAAENSGEAGDNGGDTAADGEAEDRPAPSS